MYHRRSPGSNGLGRAPVQYSYFNLPCGATKTNSHPTTHYRRSAAQSQLYGATGEREDISGQVILRADGQVIGGPTVRRTPGVTWSDPEGLRPVGGRWVVYKDEQTGQARIQFTIVLSFEKKQQLEMDGVVMAVDGWDETTGTAGIQLQIFGGVLKRSGGTETAKGQGDFSMMKMQTGEDKLIATVGSQQKRMW